MYCGVEDDDEVDEDHEVDDEYDDHDDLGDVDIYNCALVALCSSCSVDRFKFKVSAPIGWPNHFWNITKNGKIEVGFMLDVINSALLCNSNSLFVQYLGLNLYKKLL